MVRTALVVFYLLVLPGCAGSDGLVKLRDVILGKDDNSAAAVTRTYPGSKVFSVISQAEEALVRHAAQKRMIVTDKAGVAIFESEENGYQIVSYAIKNDNGVTNVKFIIHNNSVVALSEQAMLTPIDPYAFEFAARMAKQEMNGTLSAIPVLYNGHAFVPEKVNNCTTLVRETDGNTEFFVYRLDMCKKQSLIMHQPDVQALWVWLYNS